MKPWFYLFLLLFSLDMEARGKLIITGSSTVAPVISDLAKLYERRQSDIRIDVQTGGSSRGILDARKGLAQIGMVSRSLKKTENDLHSFTLARDGLVLVVHGSNPIQELSKKQVMKIYKGEIKNWKEVGGRNQEIVVVNKAEGRSTLELFLKFFKLKNSQIEADIIIGDNEQGIKTISKNKNAIGYVSVGAAEYNASIGVPLKLLNYNGIMASVENVEKGLYPLVRELNLVTRMKPSGSIKDFIEFVLSKRSRKIIREHYLVPVSSH